MTDDDFAERLFVALESEAELRESLGTRVRAEPSDLDRLRAFALSPSAALPAGLAERFVAAPRLRRDLAALLARVAVARVPSVAAAATGRPRERHGDGVLIRLVPSRSTAGQTFLVVEWTDPSAAVAATMVLLPPDGAPVKLSLPAPVDGRAQTLIDDASDAGRALADPATELVLT